MPTPVATARQCLDEAAARALDDAVSVARRRSHTQTSSLHAVSALLSISPPSPLRAAFARAPRLQVRALELSVGVGLDRLPTCRPPNDQPPVANSLMAAIKRSQANQRRNPDTWQLYQSLQNASQPVNSVIKVEMRHFILSILDDPIVNRVLREAGFHHSDIKISILHPAPVGKLPIYPPGLFNFPFCMDIVDDNCKRIREIMVKRKGNKRNPLLIGAFANDALSSFVRRVREGEGGARELEGVSVVCLENEGNYKELRGVLGNGCGRVLVSVGDFSGLVGKVYLELSELMSLYGERIWVIGAVASYDMYMKVLGRFPSMENDWDLQVLPITSSTSTPGFSSKSSLMGSFVPLGGFFPSPSEFSIQLSCTPQPARCGLCNEKYENEVSAALGEGSDDSKTGDYSAKGDKTLSEAKLMNLQTKWNDICRRLHCTKPLIPDAPKTVSPLAGNTHFAISYHQTSSNDSSSTQTGCPYLITSSPMDIRRATVSKPALSNPMIFKASDPMSITENHQVSPSSVTSVTTDLGLGTISAPKELENHMFENHRSRLQCFPGAVLTKPDGFGKNESNRITSPQIDVRDFKSIYRVLSEKIGRQNEALSTVCQAISRCKAGLGRPRGLGQRGDIWLNFVGHDKVGKKKVAQTLAEIIFGNKETMVSVDLAAENGTGCSDSIFRGQNNNNYVGKSRGKTGVDCIVDELSKNPHSVVFLENVEKADYLSQNNLLQAIKTGRLANLANSHQKEISINNTIFVTTSSTSKVHDGSLYEQSVRFSEERILEAKNWQMMILVRYVDDYTRKTNGTNVLIVERKQSSNTRKRKFIDMNESTLDEQKRSDKGQNFLLDLNLPVEEEEDIENETSESDTDSDNSKVWLEEFLDQVDDNVLFQPVNFDALSNEVLREIDRRLSITVGSNVVLEIDNEVAVQVVAAAWLSGINAIENWIQHVLGRSFEEAKERCNSLNGRTILKLVACEGINGEEQPLGVCLPSRITIR